MGSTPARLTTVTRVAAVVEQCWHDVPGGTATSTNALLAAVVARDDAPEIVGVAARHRSRPHADVVPPVPVRHARLPRRALYAAWLWARQRREIPASECARLRAQGFR